MSSSPGSDIAMPSNLKLILPSRLLGELVPWRGSAGEERLTVVCRASYRLEPGSVTSLEHASGPGGAQAPFKSATDVLVVGQGGGGEPGRLEVGKIDKRLIAVDGALSGTGPLDADSTERRRWLGGHADWREAHLAERGFPGDADWRYWNVAPADQQLARPLAADERIVVAGPGKAPLTTRLSGERALGYVAPRAQAPAAEADPIDMLADTLYIDLDRGVCTVSWRGQVDPSAGGVVFVALAHGDEDFDSIRRRARARSVPVSARTAERAVARQGSVALPFTAQSTGDKAPPAPVTTGEGARVETGTLGPAELRAAMGNLTPEQRDVAPWLAPPQRASPTGAGTKEEKRGSAWNSLAPDLPQRPSGPPPRPSAPPPRPSAPPPPLGVSPAPALTPPPRAVLSPATFAAASVAHSSPPREEPVAPTPSREATPAATGKRSEHTQLIWYEPGSVERVRAYFSDLIDELDFVEPDPKRDLASDDPAEAKAHHHCLGVLSRGRPGGARSLHEAFDDASADGAFVAPIVLLEGDLRPCFDAVAEVERLVALLEPLALGDDKLQGELEQVGKLLDSSYSLRVGGTAERVSRQLEQLFTPKHRAAVEGIGDKVQRLLLEDRAFARRKVFGASQLRATLTCSDTDDPVVAYLPEEIGEQLPLFASFRSRVLAEVHPRQDAAERHPLALSVVAVGRLVRPQDVSRWGQSRRPG